MIDLLGGSLSWGEHRGRHARLEGDTHEQVALAFDLQAGELANKLRFQGYVEFYKKVNLAYPDYDLDVGDDEDGSEHDEDNKVLMAVSGNGVRIKLLVERVFA
ncbi:hypothetical protein D8674_013036 [Pyrus ussuriensis x Pyrus communis]|uniref:Uncharacterized protein n=1 Tax=Pyrus ussuriensis x Pyrus communis TaxID=2448454 RepID=A0A5N5GPT5_9ROSA|nr:hypothetical protein D8674_013036 [Pyrus ussuriensis x Pyrus communis]